MASGDLRVGALDRLASLREIDWERELSDPSNDTSSLSLVSGLGLGVLIGCIVALLLAPRSGRRMREQVRYTAIELRDRKRRWPANNAETLADEAEQAEVDLLRRLSEPEQA